MNVIPVTFIIRLRDVERIRFLDGFEGYGTETPSTSRFVHRDCVEPSLRQCLAAKVLPVLERRGECGGRDVFGIFAVSGNRDHAVQAGVPGTCRAAR